MRILRLPIYFLPEQTSASVLISDMWEGFEQNGIISEEFAPMPSRGVDSETRKKYKKIKYEELYNGAVRIHRFNMFREEKNSLQRALRYFFIHVVHYFKACKQKDIDAIFSSSTPPTQGMLCALVKKKLKKPFIYNLQDIFPDSLVTTGLTQKDSLLWKIGRKIEDYTYKNADKIIVISDSFKENIMAKGVPEEKIEVISNWIDTDSVMPVSKEDNKLYDEYGIDRNKFIVVYAGNFGAAQGAEVVLEAAEALRDNENIHFVIFGGGANFENAKKTVQEKELVNVSIDGLLPSNRISEVYSLGDVCLITCKKGVGNSGMPSKTWSIMACNTPIIASFDTDSELADIIKKSGAGICVEPEDAEQLKEAILQAYQNKDLQNCNARDFVEKYASKKVCVPKYVKILEDCLNESIMCNGIVSKRI